MKLIKATNWKTNEVRVFENAKNVYESIGNPDTKKEMVYNYIDDPRGYSYNLYWKLETFDEPVCENLEKKFNSLKKK